MKFLKNAAIFIFMMTVIFLIGTTIDEPEGPGFEWPKCVEGTYLDSDHICREPGE